MKEATGNLWFHLPYDVRVITTNGTVKRNGSAVMGRGCAREARERFDGIEKRLGTYLTKYGNRPFRLMPDLISFPVKHHWFMAADHRLIAQSTVLLVDMVNKFGYENVVLPRPGCGNGGLKWDEVRKILKPLLDDRFTVITFEEDS